MEFYYDLPEECAFCVEEIASEAPNMDGEYYRVAKSGQSLQDSFAPQYVTGKGPKKEYPCHNCGASVFTTYKKAAKLIKDYPKIGDCIFRGNIISDLHGPVLPLHCCPPIKPIRKWQADHKDWYQLKGVDPEQIFSEDKPEEQAKQI